MTRMHRTVWLLAVCQALLMTGNTLMITTSALVGQSLAPRPGLATLPLALQFFATMLTTLPASWSMKRAGRQAGFMVGAVFGIGGALAAAHAVQTGAFAWFCAGSALIGMANGFGVFYRFAAIDVATADYRSRAVSYVLAGGIVAAFAGPNLANWTRDLVAAEPFYASYTGLALVHALAIGVLLFVKVPRPSAAVVHQSGRPLIQIMRQPVFIVALLGAMLGYGIMSLVMTATPLAMQRHAHAFSDAAFVIEWHVLGMFAPSFVTGHLIRRFGVLRIMMWGALCMVGCVGANLSGTAVGHFWLALVLLGVGWNFLFVGGTTLLAEAYAPAEEAKVQAINDFIVFGSVTGASLPSGALLQLLGWRAVNLGVTPLIAVILGAVLWLRWLRARGVPA